MNKQAILGIDLGATNVRGRLVKDSNLSSITSHESMHRPPQKKFFYFTD